jgi:ABC-type lipoprotein export system ATPase subunit
MLLLLDCTVYAVFMTNRFHFEIPRTNEPNLAFSLGLGDVVYMLGANGSGKSALVSRFFLAHQARAKRISAHRQTWFYSNALQITPAAREELERNIRVQDAQSHSRYRLDYGNERAGVAMFDLIDSDNILAQKIAQLVRAGDIANAKVEGKKPAPIQVINELMRLSNIPVEINLGEGAKIIAKKNGGPGYSIAELSDGERNAFLIAADVLTAKPGTLLLIDEPERHLHRSIVSPLLRMLFDNRNDCTFIVSTHELMLPLDTPQAATLLIRECKFNGTNVTSWTLDMIPAGEPIEDRFKQDLLGSRRKILFVEGTPRSLDVPLYSLLFPQI